MGGGSVLSAWFAWYFRFVYIVYYIHLLMNNATRNYRREEEGGVLATALFPSSFILVQHELVGTRISQKRL